ncbi:eukaryotic translation initiation factor 4 gamma 2-like isoform X2 [Alosa pseudoharengus]|uniref:eukaryotic translation initiation factor 4 gamma 2-like isoform X2 n=1 Tax=Alosa pseudoharengus TaxID=34774 RepID=UPI003F8A537F
MTQGMKIDFFLDGPFMTPRMKLDRETLGGLADMFRTNASSIGTGSGVIQDRFSPTMGRHRSNPLFNGHGGHMAPQPQSQFDLGVKPFMKTNHGQNQHFHNQNQSHPSQQQAQSKDMPPRFIKKGQLNADEVRAGGFATQQPHAVCPISLRPAHSFPVNKNQVPKLQPQIPTKCTATPHPDPSSWTDAVSTSSVPRLSFISLLTHLYLRGVLPFTAVICNALVSAPVTREDLQGSSSHVLLGGDVHRLCEVQHWPMKPSVSVPLFFLGTPTPFSTQYFVRY